MTEWQDLHVVYDRLGNGFLDGDIVLGGKRSTVHGIGPRVLRLLDAGSQ
jgi:hypothetical protein